MRHLNRQFASDKLPLLFQETPDRMTASSPKGESHNNNSFLHLRVPPLAERLKSTLTEVRPCSSVLHLPPLSVFDFVPFDSASSLTLSCVYPLPFARYFKVRPRPTVPTAARLRFHLSEIDCRSGKSMPGWILSSLPLIDAVIILRIVISMFAESPCQQQLAVHRLMTTQGDL